MNSTSIITGGSPATTRHHRKAIAAVLVIIAIIAAGMACAGVDAHRYLTGRAPLFALRGSRHDDGITRTDYRGMWYRASVITFDDGNGYSHLRLGPGAPEDPPFDVSATIGQITDELDRQELKAMSSRRDADGYVTDCGRSTDDGGTCAPERVGEDPQAFSRARILDWSRDGNTVHAYVHAMGMNFYRSLDSGRLVEDSGGESTWTADFDVSGPARLTALRPAGDGVSSMSVKESDWPRHVQDMLLMQPHDGSPTGSRAMLDGVRAAAYDHYKPTDRAVYHLIDGKLVKAE